MDNAAVLNVAIWVIATVSTALATWVVSRRKGKGDFLGDVLKENEYLRVTGHEKDKKIHELNSQIARLDEQGRTLGQENARLVRQEHQEVMDRLEAFITRAEVSRTGARGTDTKLDEIHTLVNDRLDKALAKIESLEHKLEGR